MFFDIINPDSCEEIIAKNHIFKSVVRDYHYGYEHKGPIHPGNVSSIRKSFMVLMKPRKKKLCLKVSLHARNMKTHVYKIELHVSKMELKVKKITDYFIKRS